ncbi:hypothetical protein PC116_g4823 [Phytophthora cactorum]|uniref:Uncharacterized protein n=2 Tax=Phytophthora cactorum TaxID=29920 RepID=A0A8T1ECZ1_9STRA|nr:hypothetical protein PC111_g3033 [Phytophthora cactorum]KAG2923696.1 hypothetical protein PC114_g4720 [Phytophthora cactorum]KAG2951109.1 hypothetical protein PC117_g3852 [Phytophthora cactorum]KAG2997601.1 hypothetical protein PC118_g1792 [Phytophthora cactorum]KAG3032235.1 hypothetical protein PC120_g2558 [Phytophthora cactorum]
MAREAMVAASTLSLKDAQRCFDKERQSFLRDLETLRQQLVKKDQSAARAAAAASVHTIQLKREIATLQTAMAAVEAERTKFQEQFAHTSSLLETALDQRQDDQTKVSRLNETLRTLEKKHEETVELVKKEAASNVRATQEERQALRARVEHLRGKLETQRKEWQNVHRPVADELQKCKTRLQLVDKELQDARYRERSSFQLKEKMSGEVTMYKRKVADLSTALQEAFHAKSELKAEYASMVRHMKDKWREVLRNNQHSKEQLMMLQEDYNGLFRSRTCVEQQNQQIYQAMKQMKARHEQMMKAKEEECWEIEKKHKKMSVTCPQCLKTPEQKQQNEEFKLDAVREQTRLEVTKNLELERWDRFQEVNSKYLDICKQLHTAVEECELLRGKCKTVTNQHQELQAKEQKLLIMLKEAQDKVREMSAKRDEETQQMEGTKKTMHDLVENLTNLTAVTADQSKKLQELEAARLQEREHFAEQIRNLEADKNSIAQDHEQLTHRYEEFVAQYEVLKQEKSKHWNEIVQAQLSANLLIEEQAHTIDDLLQAKANGTYVSPLKPTLSPKSARISSPSSTEKFASHEHASLVANLRQECEAYRDEVARLKDRIGDERISWQSDSDKKKESEVLGEIKRLQLEQQKLKKRIAEQALTIHELTLQDDEDDDDEGDEEQSFACSSEQVATNFDPGASSYTDSCASPGGWHDIDRRAQVFDNPPRQQGDGFWLPPSSRSPGRGKDVSTRPTSRSPFKRGERRVDC